MINNILRDLKNKLVKSALYFQLEFANCTFAIYFLNLLCLFPSELLLFLDRTHYNTVASLIRTAYRIKMKITLTNQKIILKYPNLCANGYQ